jgi:glycosyltransferase involved in cell wall biosynthesis
LTPQLLVDAATTAGCKTATKTGPRVRVTYVLGSLLDGGTERQVLELIRHLDRTRFEPSLVLMEDANIERSGGLVDQCFVMETAQAGNSHWLLRSASLVRSTRRAQKYLQHLRTDIVHALLPGPCILGGLAARLAKVPLIIGSRRSLPSQYRAHSRMGAWADSVALRLANYNLGNSHAVCREMIDIAGCPSEKCGTIYNGVDLQTFRPGLSPIVRQQMGWTSSEIVFGMVANFRACKRHRDFMEAAAILAQRHSNARFLMAGADAGARHAVQQQVEALSLNARVRILNSTPSPETIFAALDVCVCTSEAEGFSNMLLEAMACGKPLIATQVGGNAEAVRHGDTGFLVSAADPHAVANAEARLLLDGALRRTMGMAGRKRVENHFSLNSMVRAHEDLYSALLRERRQTGSGDSGR